MMRYAQHGDLAAFDVLYARHRGPLYRYLLRGARVPAEADELFQDVWRRLVEHRNRYQPSARFAAWLFTLAHHRLMDHYRAQRPQDQLPETLAAATSSQPEAIAERQDVSRRLLEALAALPEEQREIIVMREERDLTLEEIATIQGVGRETVKSRLRYALAKLRGVLT